MSNTLELTRALEKLTFNNCGTKYECYVSQYIITPVSWTRAKFSIEGPVNDSLLGFGPSKFSYKRLEICCDISRITSKVSSYGSRKGS